MAVTGLSPSLQSALATIDVRGPLTLVARAADAEDRRVTRVDVTADDLAALVAAIEPLERLLKVTDHTALDG